MDRRFAKVLVMAFVFFLFSFQHSLSQAKVLRIGVFQIVSHPALDDLRDGFVDGMKERGYLEGKNVKYDFKNAQGEMANALTIARQFAMDEVDLICAITTPCALPWRDGRIGMAPVRVDGEDPARRTALSRRRAGPPIGPAGCPWYPRPGDHAVFRALD